MARKQRSSFGRERGRARAREPQVPIVPSPTTPGYHYPAVLGASLDSLPGDHGKDGIAGFSDDEIRGRVIDEINSRSDIPDSSAIHVDVQSGVVRLSGTAPDEYGKRAAAEVAMSVPSVSDVNDEIRVVTDQQDKSEMKKHSATAEAEDRAEPIRIARGTEPEVGVGVSSEEARGWGPNRSVRDKRRPKS